MQKTIFIGGEQRKVSFGTLFMLNFQEKNGYSPLSKIADLINAIPKDATDDMELGASFFAGLDFSYMVQVLKVGLETAAELDGNPVEMDKAQLCEWVDEAGGLEVLMQAMGLMFQALPTGKSQNGKAAASAKKK